jgi:ferredoxin
VVIRAAWLISDVRQKMARIEQRVAQNVPGRFYVEWSCIYCELCAQMAPTVFREFEPQGWAFVFHQPSTPEEARAAMEAVESCPTESIGFDGDRFDWSSIPPGQDLSSSTKNA